MKKIISTILAVVMLTGIFALPASAEDKVTVLLNGEELVFDVPAQILDGRTMVPMRKIFESMGAVVYWEGETKTILANKDDIHVVMQIDNTTMFVNDDEITLDVPPQLIGGRTLVPARAVAESLKAKVDWEPATKTVIITEQTEDVPDVTFVDLNKETDFACSVGATYTYGFDDIWSKTIGTDVMPSIHLKNTAYRGQVLLISPIYANFAIDDSGYAKVTYKISRKNPNGEEAVLAEDIVAIDGKTMPNQLIKSTTELQYSLDDTDPLGRYTFTIESTDVVGNKTCKSVFNVDFKEYGYVKNEFKSLGEFFTFLCNYGRNPEPDRIIDAIIYAEKNELITYPIVFAGLVEMLAKNSYQAESAVEEFEKEFGKNGTETLRLVENSAAQYLEMILSQEYPTFSNVAYSEDINGDIMLYGSAIGAYMTGASYGAAKAIVKSASEDTYSTEKMNEYMVPDAKTLADGDQLFRAYCTYMLNYDSSVSNAMKNTLKKILG